MRRIILAAALVGSWVPIAYAANSCLKYEPALVELEGTIVLRTFFGPPNYGEDPATDSRDTQSLLELDHPICVDEDPSDETTETEVDQRVVTLVPHATGVKFQDYVGKHVTITGSLFHAQTAHHHTQILMRAKTVQISRPSSRKAGASK